MSFKHRTSTRQMGTRHTTSIAPTVDTPWGYTGHMEIPTESRHDIMKRLRRIEGQIRGLQNMVDQGRDCNDTLTQFAAASRALSRAGFKFLSATMEQCRLHPDEAIQAGYTPETLEKMFLRLG